MTNIQQNPRMSAGLTLLGCCYLQYPSVTSRHGSLRNITHIYRWYSMIFPLKHGELNIHVGLPNDIMSHFLYPRNFMKLPLHGFRMNGANLFLHRHGLDGETKCDVSPGPNAWSRTSYLDLLKTPGNKSTIRQKTTSQKNNIIVSRKPCFLGARCNKIYEFSSISSCTILKTQKKTHI